MVRTIHGVQHQAVEWALVSGKIYADPFNDVLVDVIFTEPSGEEMRLPAFWAGEQEWRVRFGPRQPGEYHFRTVCSDTENPHLHGLEGKLQIAPYEGKNELLRHGPLRVSENRHHLEHQDGVPFFWLGDTWWMGMCDRLDWPEGFQLLTADRRRKGFSLIQFVVGFSCGMEPFDQRDANAGGLAWDAEYARINPSYLEMADLRVQWLVRQGLVPCILGSWGYHILWMGIEKMKRHYRELIARYGAYPVVWCLAGEVAMPYYLSPDRDGDTERLKVIWTEVARYIRETDPYHHPIAAHPRGSYGGRDDVVDESVLDFEMLQSGHGGTKVGPFAIEHLRKALARTPKMPVINDELLYEGVMGTNWDDTQRWLFWTTMLSGAAGFTYGAVGIWEFNNRNELFGQFPHGPGWGITPWEDAHRFPGSEHVGIGRRILEKYDWWRLEPYRGWLEPSAEPDDHLAPYAASIADGQRIFYFPVPGPYARPPRSPMFVTGLSDQETYDAKYVDPSTGKEYPLGRVEPDGEGRWGIPVPNYMRDWVLIFDPAVPG